MSADCCHRVYLKDGTFESFPLLCVGTTDDECCEQHGAARVFPPRAHPNPREESAGD